VLDMAAAEDKDPVEAVGAERSYAAFGVGVRVRHEEPRLLPTKRAAAGST
jgi:hypothetical protein